MTAARTRLVLVAAFVVASVGVAGWWRWWSSTGSPAPGRPVASAVIPAAPASGPRSRHDAPSRPVTTPPSALPAVPTPASAVPKALRSVRMMFDGRYFAATLAHAAAWRDLASTCADGTVAACVELGVQLRDRPPSLVLGAKLAFDAACELGDDAACATAAELKQRLRLASAGDLDDDGDGGFEDACAARDLAICGDLAVRAMFTEEDVDEAMGLRACLAGHRDACGAVAGLAEDPAVVLQALIAGCDLPDAMFCEGAAQVLAGHCEELRACPPADPARAAQLATLACRLDPSVAPRCTAAP